jgi:hypothetical protein
VALGLRAVSDVLGDANDPCHDWVEAVHARTAQVVFASGSIWSRRTAHGTGILTTAAHVLTPCYVDGTQCAAALDDPTEGPGMAVIKLAEVGGGAPKNDFSGHFTLYNELIPPEENTANLTGIRPRHDFTVYAVDSQTFEDDGTSIGHSPDPIVDAELPLHDPDGDTLADPSWADPSAGDRVVLLGFPAGGPTAGALSASVGRVLDAGEIDAALVALAAAGDEEGGIPYDPEAEMILEGHAMVGMSGGGVFDAQGLQVGVMVRASTADIGVQYVRVVRMAWIVARLEAAMAAAAPPLAAAVAPYLETR